MYNTDTYTAITGDLRQSDKITYKSNKTTTSIIKCVILHSIFHKLNVDIEVTVYKIIKINNFSNLYFMRSQDLMNNLTCSYSVGTMNTCPHCKTHAHTV